MIKRLITTLYHIILWLRGVCSPPLNRILGRRRTGRPYHPRRILRIKTFRKTPFRDMPRYQPCPRGHGFKKRVRKTAGGAVYHCNHCGDFLVRVHG